MIAHAATGAKKIKGLSSWAAWRWLVHVGSLQRNLATTCDLMNPDKFTGFFVAIRLWDLFSAGICMCLARWFLEFSGKDGFRVDLHRNAEI